MELSFLGTGSAYNPALGNTSAYCFYGDTLLLLDCGETVFEALYARDILRRARTILIAVTHFHSDHIGSLGSTLSYCRCILNKQAYLLYPTPDICALLAMTGVPAGMYEYCGKAPDSMPFCLTAVEVRHDPMIKCYGYLISDGLGRIFYGGDSTEIPAEILAGLRSGEVSRIYQDVTYEKSDRSCAHGTLEHLKECVEPELRSRITCDHFGSDLADQIRAAGFVPASAEE